MKALMFLLIVTITLITSNSCGTIFGGTSSTVFVDSKPQGADVSLNGMKIGKTPMPIKLKNKSDYVITLSYADKNDYFVLMDTEVRPWAIIGNCLTVYGIIVWNGVDLLTGGIYKPKQYKHIRYDFDTETPTLIW